MERKATIDADVLRYVTLITERDIMDEKIKDKLSIVQNKHIKPYLIMLEKRIQKHHVLRHEKGNIFCRESTALTESYENWLYKQLFITGTVEFCAAVKKMDFQIDNINDKCMPSVKELNERRENERFFLDASEPLTDDCECKRCVHQRNLKAALGRVFENTEPGRHVITNDTPNQIAEQAKTMSLCPSCGRLENTGIGGVRVCKECNGTGKPPITDYVAKCPTCSGVTQIPADDIIAFCNKCGKKKKPKEEEKVVFKRKHNPEKARLGYILPCGRRGCEFCSREKDNDTVIPTSEETTPVTEVPLDVYRICRTNNCNQKVAITEDFCQRCKDEEKNFIKWMISRKFCLDCGKAKMPNWKGCTSTIDEIKDYQKSINTTQSKITALRMSDAIPENQVPVTEKKETTPVIGTELTDMPYGIWWCCETTGCTQRVAERGLCKRCEEALKNKRPTIPKIPDITERIGKPESYNQTKEDLAIEYYVCKAVGCSRTITYNGYCQQCKDRVEYLNEKPFSQIQ